MSKITIQRTNKQLPDERALSGARELLFGALDGFTEDDRRAWRRLWKRLVNSEPGELLFVDTVMPRNPWFHRKFFGMLNLGYEAWDPGRKHKTHKGIPVLKNFEQFREDVTIMAGYYEQTYNLKGELRVVAKSISFAKMEQPEFEKLYNAVADVLLEHVLTNYAGRDQLDDVVNNLMGFL